MQITKSERRATQSETGSLLRGREGVLQLHRHGEGAGGQLTQGAQRDGDGALVLAVGQGDGWAWGLHTPFWGGLPALPPGTGTFCLLPPLVGWWDTQISHRWRRAAGGGRAAGRCTLLPTAGRAQRAQCTAGDGYPPELPARLPWMETGWTRADRMPAGQADRIPPEQVDRIPLGRCITSLRSRRIASLLLACPPGQQGWTAPRQDSCSAWSDAEPTSEDLPDQEETGASLSPASRGASREPAVGVSSGRWQHSPAGLAMGRGVSSLLG